MMSRIRMLSGFVAVGLFVAGILIAVSQPASSKDRPKGSDKASDPGSGITLVKVGL